MAGDDYSTQPNVWPIVARYGGRGRTTYHSFPERLSKKRYLGTLEISLEEERLLIKHLKKVRRAKKSRLSRR